MKTEERYHLSMFREKKIRNKWFRLFRVKPGDKKQEKLSFKHSDLNSKDIAPK